MGCRGKGGWVDTEAQASVMGVVVRRKDRPSPVCCHRCVDSLIDITMVCFEDSKI